MKRDWTEARAKVDHEGECRNCGKRTDLQAAHILPRSLGGGQTPEAIVPLCLWCHGRYDNGQLDLLHALTFAEQAEAVSRVGINRALARISPSANPRRVAT